MPDTWKRFNACHCSVPALDLTLDISRMDCDVQWLKRMQPAMREAYAAMADLEAGAIANPDEQRRVGHYWLRAPQLAPAEYRAAIRRGIRQVSEFAGCIHAAGKFTDVLSIGIGGSALGPMFAAGALGHPQSDQMRVHFIDNTDPDGIALVLAGLYGRLARTLVIVTSKSGGTPETHNGMKTVEAAYRDAGLNFAKHAVAITMPGSKLDQRAQGEGWLERFPMFDWVGGRTSELSAVGLLPAALQGLDIDEMLAGAAACDKVTRSTDTRRNPAALLALMWYCGSQGKGRRDMVVLPYKDRLLLFARYLQQLVMESLGKRLNLKGKVVEQGLTVYGNKGSTDQHAYVQQLRDGVNNFFTVFLRVLESGGAPLEVEPGVTAGDYLHSFLLGTRDALTGNGRQSVTLTVRRVDARTVGVLIALFERAVGFYATLIGINAYHQPGVEAGKKAAAGVLELQARLIEKLSTRPRSAAELAGKASPELAYLILEHLAANGRARMKAGRTPAEARFSKLR